MRAYLKGVPEDTKALPLIADNFVAQLLTNATRTDSKEPSGQEVERQRQHLRIASLGVCTCYTYKPHRLRQDRITQNTLALP